MLIQRNTEANSHLHAGPVVVAVNKATEAMQVLICIFSQVLSAVNSMDARITHVEDKVDGPRSTPSSTPALPPKSPGIRNASHYEDVR